MTPGILITGGSGLVGTYLKDYVNGIFVSSKDYNLTIESEVIRMYEDYKPEVIIHLAARVGGIIDNINYPFEYLEDNILMNTFLLKYARLYKVKKFLGILSSCIYPDYSDTYPLKESYLHKDLPNENNFGYGYAKRLLGVHIDIAKKQGLNYSYIIPSNLYGEFESGDLSRKHFVGALLDKIITANKNGDSSITLFGDGSPLRQFTYAKDLAEIIELIIKYDIKENLNVSCNNNMSIDQMARLALKATNSEHLSIIYDESKPNGQYRKDIDTTNFKNIFPSFEFTDYIIGISKVYNKIKSRYE